MGVPGTTLGWESSHIYKSKERCSPASSLTRWGGSGRCSSRGGSGRAGAGRRRKEALAERSVELAQVMVPLAGALARGVG